MKTRLLHKLCIVTAGVLLCLLAAAIPSGQLRAETVAPPVDMLLTSDRLLYQPGQKIWLRVYLVDAQTRAPLANQSAVFVLRNPDGDTVMRAERSTDAFGLAHVSCPLAREALVGDYVAQVRGHHSLVQIKLKVENFHAPRMVLELRPEQNFMLVNRDLPVTVSARYGFGAAVVGGRVEVKIVTRFWPAKAGQPRRLEDWEPRFGTGNVHATVAAELDREGSARFVIPAEEQLLQRGREGDHAVLVLLATVTDGAGYAQETQLQLPLVFAPLIVSGHWLGPVVAGLQNRLALVVRQPDGTPVAAQVDIELPGSPPVQRSAHTGDSGVVLVDLPIEDSGELKVRARVQQRSGFWQTTVQPDRDHNTLLLAPQPVAAVGSAVQLEIRSREPGQAGLVLSSGDRVLYWQRLNLKRGSQVHQLRLPRDTLGLLSVHLFRDDAAVWVPLLALDQTRLGVEVVAKPPASSPGGRVELQLRVVDQAGRPTAAAIELGVLDQAIYQLQGQGLQGDETLFRYLPQSLLGTLAKAPGVDALFTAPRLAQVLADQELQQTMRFWLGACRDSRQQGRFIQWRARPQVAQRGPVALSHFASVVSRLPKIPQAVNTALLKLTGPMLAVWAALLLLFRVGLSGLRRRRLLLVLVGLHLLALVALPVLPLARGPQQSAVEEFDPVQSVIGRWDRPRKYPGLAPELLDSTTALEAHDDYAPDVGTVVRVTPSWIEVNGRKVLALEGYGFKPGQLHPNTDGYLIQPLFDHLLLVADQLKRGSKMAPDRAFRGVMTVIAEADVPYSVLTRLLYTSGQAEFGTWSMLTPQELVVVAPPVRGPATHPLLFVLFFCLALVLLRLSRCGIPGYLSWALLALYALLHFAQRSYPQADLESLSFPQQQGLCAVTPWLGIAIAVSLAWEVWRRRQLPLVLLSMALLFAFTAQFLSRDFGLYFLPAAARAVAAPRIGAGAAPADADADTALFQLSPDVQSPRSHFPSTAYYHPGIKTDPSGQAQVSLTLGQQLTGWRGTALVSSATGGLGLGRFELTTSQPLQVEAAVPSLMTTGDRLLLPVSVYNHSSQPQRVTVHLPAQPWFQLEQGDPQQVTLQPQKSAALAFPMRLVEAGMHRLVVAANSGALQDAVEHALEVVPPHTVRIEQTQVLALPQQRVVLRIPPSSVPGSESVQLVLYQNLLSRLTDGIERMLLTPNGCAEQTISSTLPNLLLGDYLRQQGGAQPELLQRADNNTLLGLQRLLNYQHENGGFSYYGKGHPVPWLSAYALEFLAHAHASLGIAELPLRQCTAYVATQLKQPQRPLRRVLYLYSIAQALTHGHLPELRRDLQKALDELVQQRARSEDAQLLALLALTLQQLQRDTEASALVPRLLQLAKKDRAGGLGWSAAASEGGGTRRGICAKTTAMVAQVLRRSGHKQQAQQAITWLLLHWRAGGFDWTSRDNLFVTSTLLSSLQRSDRPETRAQLRWNGAPLPGGDRGGPHEVDLGDSILPGEDNVLLAQHLPQGATAVVRSSWRVPLAQARQFFPDSSLRLQVWHTPTEVVLRSTQRARIELANNGGNSSMLLVHYYVAPGFEVVRRSLQQLVQEKKIDRYEVRNSGVIFYLQPLVAGGRTNFQFSLRAVTIAQGQSGGSFAYEYYFPENRAFAKAELLQVKAASLKEKVVGSPVMVVLPYQPFQLRERPPQLGLVWPAPRQRPLLSRRYWYTPRPRRIYARSLLDVLDSKGDWQGLEGGLFKEE